MRIDLFLATRFIREGWTQSLLLVAAAAVGITVVFFLTALITAVERTMISQTLDVVPHVVIRRPDETARPALISRSTVRIAQDVNAPAQRVRSVENWLAVMEQLDTMDGVAGVTPVAAGPGIATRGAATRAVTLLGVDPDRFARVIAIRPRIESGAFEITGSEVVIGIELATDLGATVGDRVRISTGEGREDVFRVAGVFDLGSRDVNERWALVPLRRAQGLLDLPGGISSLDLRAGDLWSAAELAGEIERRTGLTAEAWTETNAQLEIAIRSQRGATLMIRLFVMVAVAMGIASVLIVSTIQKAKQIGILRAIGLSRAAVQRVFLAQGILVGLAGAAVGTAAGTVLALASMRGARNPDGSPTYPIELPVSLYVTAFAIAVLTGLVAASLPARRAARLDPANAIRHE